MGTIPIVLFVYNRPDHIKLTVDSLKENILANESQLFIYSDGPKNENDLGKIKEVRNFIHSLRGFKSIDIIEHKENMGLAKSVISGVSEIINSFSKVIVLEDDMISSHGFLSYMNELLSFYESNDKIFSVSGYTFPIKIPSDYKHEIYLAPRASSWGWGTWKDRWNKVDWNTKNYGKLLSDNLMSNEFKKGGDDLIRMLENSKKGKIDSWAIIWTYAHFVNNACCIYPVRSRIKNIGTDKSGTHTKKTTKFDVELTESINPINPHKNIQPDEEIIDRFRTFFKKNILSTIVNKIRMS